jgi:hypothetical protein
MEPPPGPRRMRALEIGGIGVGEGIRVGVSVGTVVGSGGVVLVGWALCMMMALLGAAVQAARNRTKVKMKMRGFIYFCLLRAGFDRNNVSNSGLGRGEGDRLED